MNASKTIIASKIIEQNTSNTIEHDETMEQTREKFKVGTSNST